MSDLSDLHATTKWRNTAAMKAVDQKMQSPADVLHPTNGVSGQETGVRDGMVETVNGVVVCYTCQQVGHINRNCPLRKGQAASDPTEDIMKRAAEKMNREQDRNDFRQAQQ